MFFFLLLLLLPLSASLGERGGVAGSDMSCVRGCGCGRLGGDGARGGMYRDKAGWLAVACPGVCVSGSRCRVGCSEYLAGRAGWCRLSGLGPVCSSAAALARSLARSVWGQVA